MMGSVMSNAFLIHLFPAGIATCQLRHCTVNKTENGLRKNTGWSKILCAPDDYNTESYKLCSKFPPPVSRHLLTRRTVFSKTVFSIERSTFRMYCVMAIFKSSIVFCTVIIRCTETFWSPSTYWKQHNSEKYDAHLASESTWLWLWNTEKQNKFCHLHCSSVIRSVYWTRQ
jgi:hypothetical protein